MRTLPLFRPTLLVAALAIGLAACDATGAETFDLEPRRVKFDFRFDGSALDVANLLEFTSENSIDLREYVRQRGFSPEDVVGARVQNGRAEIRVARPAAANVSSFSRAEIRPFQGTARGALLASGQGFSGTSSTAQLTVQTGDFGNVVATGPFQAIVGLQGTNAVVPGEYLVEVTLDVIVTVEG